MKKWTIALLAVCSMQFGFAKEAAANDAYLADGYEFELHDEWTWEALDWETDYAEVTPRVDIGFEYVCTARDRRGRTFRARGDSKAEARRRALRRCYNFGSRRCHIVSCKRRLDVDL